MKRLWQSAAAAVLVCLAMFMGIQRLDAFATKFSAIPGDAGLGAVIVEGDHPRAFLSATSPNAVLAGVLAMGMTGEIRFSPGTYQFAAGVTVAYDGVRIKVDPGAILKSATSGSVGLLKFTGNYCSFTGPGKVLIEDAVNNQVVVEMETGSYSQIEDVNWEVTATDGSSANPVKLMVMDSCVESRVANNLILPNAGIQVLHWLDGSGGTIHGNVVRTDDADGIGGTGETLTNRACEKGIVVEGGEWMTITDNFLWGLGTVTTNELSDVLTLKNSNTPASTEQGHTIVRGNKIENVVAPIYVKILGEQHVVFEGNLLGYSGGSSGAGPMDAFNVSSAFDSQILIDSHNQQVKTAFGGTGKPSLQIDIIGNEFHKAPILEASNILVMRGEKVMIRDNNFALLGSKYPIRVWVESTDVTVMGNHFHGDASTTEHIVKTETSAATPQSNIMVSNNTVERFVNGSLPVVGGLGQIWPFGTVGFETSRSGTSITFKAIADSTSTTHPEIVFAATAVENGAACTFTNAGDATAGRATIAVDAATFDNTPAAGDWIKVTGTTNNDGAYQLAAATNALLTLDERFNLVTEAGVATTISTLPARSFYAGDWINVTGGDQAANRGIRQVVTVDQDDGLYMTTTNTLDFTTDATSTAAVNVYCYKRQHVRNGVAVVANTNMIETSVP